MHNINILPLFIIETNFKNIKAFVTKIAPSKILEMNYWKTERQEKAMCNWKLNPSRGTCVNKHCLL